MGYTALLGSFREVWTVDFEFSAPDGHRPTPLCVAARELKSGRVERRWLSGVDAGSPPYGTGPDTLLVAYYSSAEWGCHLALGWPPPVRVLDLFVEFSADTNGRPPQHGRGLLAAMRHYGLESIDSVEKESMRALAMRGGEYEAAEREALLVYCQSDVDALASLLPAMSNGLDIPRALLRGRYMVAAARMEWTGVPVDVEMLCALREGWDRIKGHLVRTVGGGCGAWAPSDPERPDGPQSFSAARFAAFLGRERIPWPRLPSGSLSLDDDTFREMARTYPERIGPVRELRHALGQMRLNELAVGRDGRNRTMLSAFQSKTGRNQPSNSKFVFGPSCWLRSLIRPGPGRSLAYCDWSAQELGIAAALSGDARMREAYASGDPYLWFGKFVGALPADATKGSHGRERDQFKVVMLGVLYGLGGDGLGRKLGEPPVRGRELLALHQRTFRRFWDWSDSVEETAVLTGRMRTVFGWPLQVTGGFSSETGWSLTNPRSLRNFPMQGNGGEMMRLAACLATERGVTVCAPVHDAFVIEADTTDIDTETARMESAMREASELVLPGFPLRTDAKVVRHPERYSDPRGEVMWREVTGILSRRGGDTLE